MHDTSEKLSEPDRRLACAVLIQAVKDAVAIMEQAYFHTKESAPRLESGKLLAWTRSSDSSPLTFNWWARRTGLKLEALEAMRKAIETILVEGYIPELLSDYTCDATVMHRFQPQLRNRYWKDFH